MIRWEDAKLYPAVVQYVYRIVVGCAALEGVLSLYFLFYNVYYDLYVLSTLDAKCPVTGRRFVLADPLNQQPRMVVSLFTDQTGTTVG